MVVTDRLPAGLTLVSVNDAKAATCTTGQTVTCTLTDPLAVEGKVAFQVTAKVATDAPDRITNVATVPSPTTPVVPVAGPWLALNDWGNCPIEQPRCDTNTTDKVLLIADGVFQAAGLITMVDGVLSPSQHRVVTRTADTKVHVTPTGTGFTVFGHF